MLLAFKLLITPLLIGAVTLAGRRWGGVVSGFLIGLPLTSGPISFILALEYGIPFAAHSAVGNLAGQISNCIFCLSYIALAQRCAWPLSSLGAITAFFASTFTLNLVAWQLWPALAALLIVIAAAARLVKPYPLPPGRLAPPWWDLPGRILSATVLVVLLTTIADALGPQLSGLISPFPAFSVIFAAFTHLQLGPKSASNLLRGVIVGSGGYASFFVVVAALLPNLGIALTYLLACAAAIAVGALVFFSSRRVSTAA